MPFFRILSALLRGVASDTRGNILIIVGLGIFAIISAVGASIDMGRAQRVQARLSNALDSAGLAAGAVVNSADINATANKYFAMNFPSSPEVTVSPLTIVVSEDKLTIDLSVTAQVQTAFMKIVGIPSVTVGADSQITRANKGMELVLVLDVTGSMNNSAGGGVTRLQAAKTATNSLLDILYGDETEIENLWVGLVPFSQAVNIGTSRASWTSGSPNWGTTSWGGCVEARWSGSNDVTDVTPSVAAFPKYYFPCNTSTNAWYGTNSSKTNCSTGSGLGYRSPLNTTSLGPNLFCPPALTPMTANKTTISNAVNALTATGGTEIVLGVAWAWRMLSPNWQGLWGGEMNTDNLPLAYNTPLMNKVVILMSDGDNDIVYNYYSAYGYPSSGGLGSGACSGSNCTAGETVLNNRTTQVCSAMKAQGILIYSIAFGSTISSTGQALLQGCASKPEYYFYSPTGADLQDAFQIIGDSLANLRISK